jgi:hypothetical protein
MRAHNQTPKGKMPKENACAKGGTVEEIERERERERIEPYRQEEIVSCSSGKRFIKYRSTV